ncbi:MSC_0624 family F1-like ATPase-associated membrane protein [Mesomycoplasma ovipneumoniae]|uniref:MSC_0624 family F1-like ATPase-associated membrane protein n=1 Tax=Mesomycoplasma ovipneumoniae TaxID=29562 RepID=UPI0024AC876F|nr:hypothetical protein [Mesomycoplasma ovipneumoniae]WHF53246.1 hypothetical protein QJQ40_02230 [Mesomycoplasma ovipneumoniae]
MNAVSAEAYGLNAKPAKKDKKNLVRIFLRVLFILFLLGLSTAIFFDARRSFLNIVDIDQNAPISRVSSISLIFNPIDDEIREFIAPRVARSVFLLFFSIIFLFKGLKFFGLKNKMHKYIILSVYFFLSLVNLVVYFAWLTTEWSHILGISAQIFIYILLDYSLWLWLGRTDDKINYDYKKLFTFKHISLASAIVTSGTLFGIFASMVFSTPENSSVSTVTYDNPVANWIYTFITEVAKLTNSLILIAILMGVLVLTLLYYSPQIYFYRQSFIRLKKYTPALSVLIFIAIGIFIYSVYITVYSISNFVQFLPFGNNIVPNYLPTIIGISIHVVLLILYFVLNLTRLKNKIKDYQLNTLPFIFILLSFIVSFVVSYLSYSVHETIWINSTQLVFFLTIYFALVRIKPEFPLWMKLMVSFFIILYTIFNFIYLLNIDIYTSTVSQVKPEDYQKDLVSVFYIDYSFYFLGILTLLLAIFVLTNLFIAIGKNTLILTTKNKSSQDQNQKVENEKIESS